MFHLLTLQLLLAITNQWNLREGILWVDQFDVELSESWQGRYENCDEVYKIVKEENNNYLAAHSINSDCFIAKRIEVDIVQYPYLNWKWRVHQLPEQGDESVKDYCDVPASIAIVTNKSRLFPKSIKYTWSTTLAEENLTKSPFAIWPAKCHIHVLNSGADQRGQWVQQKVNVLEDYKKFYRKKKLKSKKIHAIVIMTDSDNTQTPSSADYDDLFFSKY